MRKTKIIAILSALVILTAMTGIAAADPATVVIAADPIINPLDGTTVTDSDVKVYNISWSAMGDNHTRFISVQTSVPTN